MSLPIIVPGSSPLSLKQIQDYLGGSNPIGLNEYRGAGQYFRRDAWHSETISSTLNSRMTCVDVGSDPSKIWAGGIVGSQGFLQRIYNTDPSQQIYVPLGPVSSVVGVTANKEFNNLVYVATNTTSVSPSACDVMRIDGSSNSMIYNHRISITGSNFVSTGLTQVSGRYFTWGYTEVSGTRSAVVVSFSPTGTGSLIYWSTCFKITTNNSNVDNNVHMEAVSAAGVGNKLFVLCRRAIISTGLIDFVLVRFSYNGSGNNTAFAEKVTVVAGSGTGNSLEPTGVAVDPLGRTVVVVGRQTTPVGAFAIGFDATSCLSIWRRQFFGISSFNGDDVGLNTVHATPDGSFVAGGCTGGSSGSGYSSALALRLDAWGRMTWQTAFTSYSGSDSANTTNFTGIASLPAQTTAGINSPCSQDFYMSYSAGPVSNTRSGGVIKLDNAMAAPPSPRARLWGSGLDYTYWEEELTSQGGALVNSAMTIQESTPSTEAYYSITTNITNISLPSTSAFPAIDWYVSSVGTQFDKLNLPSTIYGTSIAVSDFSGFNVDAKWQKKTMQDTSLYLSTDRMFRDRLSRSNAVLMLNRVTTRVGSSHRANILEKTHAYDFGDLPFKVQINGFSSSILNGCCYPNGDIAVVGVTTYDTLSRATLVKLDKYGLKISQMGLYTVNNFTRFTCVDTTAKLGPDSNSANTNVVYAGGDAYPSVGMLVKIIDTAGSYSIAWQKSISLVDEIDTVIANPNGGVFAVGSRQYAGGTGNTEIHLMYFNDAGTRVWSRKLVLDIEGLSFPECVYNPGTGAFYIATFPYTIIKYTVSATGATLNWVKRYDLTQYYGPRGIMLDSVGNVVIASETSYPNYASIIFKLDPNGNPLWARQLPNNNSVQGIVADNAGGVILASQNRSASTALFGMIPNFVSDPGCTWNLGTTGVDLTPIALTMSSITLTETSSTPTVANLSNTIITLPTITVSQTPTYPYTNSNQGYV